MLEHNDNKSKFKGRNKNKNFPTLFSLIQLKQKISLDILFQKVQL